MGVVEECIAAGVDINLKGLGGRTIIGWACQASRVEIVRCLLDNGANPFIRDDNNEEAFSRSATAARIEIQAVLQPLIDIRYRAGGTDEFSGCSYPLILLSHPEYDCQSLIYTLLCHNPTTHLPSTFFHFTRPSPQQPSSLLFP